MYSVVDSLLVLKGDNENFCYVDVILILYNFYKYDVNFQPKSVTYQTKIYANKKMKT